MSAFGFFQRYALYALLVNAIAMLRLGGDKYRVRYPILRVTHQELYAWGLLGGAPGILTGIDMLSHKASTRYKSFRQNLRWAMTVHIVFAFWVFSNRKLLRRTLASAFDSD
ncbi:hypothetical protein RI367_002850 [Sorochytrium milnesiophthora]